MRKQTFSVRVSGVDQNGTLATAAMTSDAIPFKGAGIWSLNAFITGLTFTGNAPPQVTIEVSNDPAAASFTPMAGAINVTLNDRFYFDDLDSTWKYFRVKYDPQNATGGTKNFDAIQNGQ